MKNQKILIEVTINLDEYKSKSEIISPLLRNLIYDDLKSVFKRNFKNVSYQVIE
jgi:hypothetical protein